MVNDRPHSVRRKIPLGVVLVAMLGACHWTGIGKADPASADPGLPQAKPATKAAPPAAKTAAPTSQPAQAAKVKPAKKTAGKAAPAKAQVENEAASASKDVSVVAGRRDPFKLPPPPSPTGPGGGPETTGPLPPGTRGLVINQLRVEGTVRQDTTNTMIAVVTNYTNRAYFLRENDAVYNGLVSKITPDAVYFKENVLDANGRVQSREVIKRLGQAPGEGR